MIILYKNYRKGNKDGQRGEVIEVKLCMVRRIMGKKTYIVDGTFSAVVFAESEDDAKVSFNPVDIDDYRISSIEECSWFRYDDFLKWFEMEEKDD